MTPIKGSHEAAAEKLPRGTVPAASCTTVVDIYCSNGSVTITPAALQITSELLADCESVQIEWTLSGEASLAGLIIPDNTALDLGTGMTNYYEVTPTNSVVATVTGPGTIAVQIYVTCGQSDDEVPATNVIIIEP